MANKVGILYDNISGNTGDVAIGLSIKKILNELKIDFEELIPGNFDPTNFETIIIGGGHLLRPSPDFFYDKFKISGSHILNAMGVVDHPTDLNYLNEYKYITFRSNGDKNKVSYLKKETHVVPCTTMLLSDLKNVDINIEKPCIGIHFLPNFFSEQEEDLFIQWASNLPFKIYFLPITHYVNDYDYLLKLALRIKNADVLPIMTALEIFTVIGKFDYFISGSLHGAIFAYIHNVPFMLQDTEKMRFFMEDRGLEKYLFSSFDQMNNIFEDILSNNPIDYSDKIVVDLKNLENHKRVIKEILPQNLISFTYNNNDSSDLNNVLNQKNIQFNLLQTKNIDLQYKINHSEENLRLLQQLINEKNSYIDMLKEQISKKDEDIKICRDQINKQNYKLGFLKEKLITIKQRCKIYKNQLIKEENYIKVLEEDISEKNSFIKVLKEQLDNKENDIIQKNNDIYTLRQTLDQRLIELNEIKSQLTHIYNSHGWKFLLKYYKIRDFFLPSGSKQREFAKIIFGITNYIRKSIKFIKIYGVKNFFFKIKLKLKERKNEQYFDIEHINVPKIPLIKINDEIEMLKDVNISVIIPTKNAGNNFRNLLMMLNHQKGIPEIEIIVVDSGSNDETVSIAKEYNCKIIEIPPEKFSHSYSRNLGAENATGNILLFTTQDTLPPSDLWLYEMSKILIENDIVAVSCAEFPRIDADLFYRVICWNHYKFLDVDSHDRILSLPKEENYISLRKNGQLSDIACLIYKNIFMEYKYRYNYAEDLDLGIRLIKDNKKLIFLSSLKIIHSHNREPYYFLKRSYVDNIYLSKLFLDFPIPLINPKKLIFDIILSYNVLNKLIKEILKINFTCNLDYLENVVNNNLLLIENYYLPNETDINNNKYLDENFKNFLKEVFQVSRNINDKYINIEESYILNDLNYFIKNIVFDYMKGPYKLIDNILMEDFCNCLIKVFASNCGTYIAFCKLKKLINGLDKEYYDIISKISCTFEKGI